MSNLSNTVYYNQTTQPNQVDPSFKLDGDPISQLPVDQNPPNPDEIQLINTLFKKNRKTMDIVFDESKDALLVALLVIISCLPQLDKLLHKFIPITEKSPYILLLIKGLLAGALFWLIKHFYLSKKST